MLHKFAIWFIFIRVVAFQMRAGASKYEEFKVNWCRQRKWRLDWERLQKPCQNLNYRRHDGQQYQRLKTSPEHSEYLIYKSGPQGNIVGFSSSPARILLSGRHSEGTRGECTLKGPHTLQGPCLITIMEYTRFCFLSWSLESIKSK